MPYTTNPHLPRVRRDAVQLVKYRGWSMRKTARYFGVRQIPPFWKCLIPSTLMKAPFFDCLAKYSANAVLPTPREPLKNMFIGIAMTIFKLHINLCKLSPFGSLGWTASGTIMTGEQSLILTQPENMLGIYCRL